MSAAERWAAIDGAVGDGASWDELAAIAGPDAPRLAPGDEVMDVLVATALHWPVVHPALQEARRR